VEQSVIIRVLDDDVPELLEYFTLELTDPLGGALLAGTAVSSNFDHPDVYILLLRCRQLLKYQSDPMMTLGACSL